MKRRHLTIAGGVLLLLLLGWLALPRLITAVPSPIRYRLPEPLLALVTTPLPTALPAPQRTQAPPTIILPTLPPSATPTLKPSPTLPPTFTPWPTQVIEATAPATATPRPTVTPLPSPTPTPTKRPLPAAVRIENMTIIPQKFNNCGPTNLTIVLNYYGEELDQLDVAAEIRPVFDDRNVSPWQLVAYANDHTSLRARAFAGGDLQILKELIAADFPVIVEKGLHLEEEIGWMGHYLTLFGYDDTAEQFMTLDTFLGPFDSVGRSESYSNLARYWQQFNNQFIVVYRPARESEVEAILGQNYLDPILMWQWAAERAQAEIASQPDNAFAWFNLGGSLTHLASYTGDNTYYESAAAAFDQARTIGLPWRMLWYQFEPYAAYLGAGQVDEVLTLTDVLIRTGGGEFVEETHYYQGLAWEARDEPDKAQSAYRRALAVNPNFAPALERYRP